MIFTYMYITNLHPQYTCAQVSVKTKTDQEFVHSNRTPETAFRFQTGIKFVNYCAFCEDRTKKVLLPTCFPEKICNCETECDPKTLVTPNRAIQKS